MIANKSGKPEFNLNKLKDDYSQYIRRDQIRKEREHKKKVGDNKNIYNQYKKEVNLSGEQMGLINEENKQQMLRSHTPRNFTTNLGKKQYTSKDLALEKAALKEAKTARKSKKLDMPKNHNSDPVLDFS